MGRTTTAHARCSLVLYFQRTDAPAPEKSESKPTRARNGYRAEEGTGDSSTKEIRLRRSRRFRGMGGTGPCAWCVCEKTNEAVASQDGEPRPVRVHTGQYSRIAAGRECATRGLRLLGGTLSPPTHSSRTHARTRRRCWETSYSGMGCGGGPLVARPPSVSRDIAAYRPHSSWTVRIPVRPGTSGGACDTGGDPAYPSAPIAHLDIHGTNVVLARVRNQTVASARRSTLRREGRWRSMDTNIAWSRSFRTDKLTTDG